MSDKNMVFDIKPSMPLELHFHGSKIGKLDAVSIDFGNPVKIIAWTLPFSVRLSLSFNENAFASKEDCAGLVKFIQGKSKSILVKIIKEA